MVYISPFANAKETLFNAVSKSTKSKLGKKKHLNFKQHFVMLYNNIIKTF